MRPKKRRSDFPPEGTAGPPRERGPGRQPFRPCTEGLPTRGSPFFSLRKALPLSGARARCVVEATLLECLAKRDLKPSDRLAVAYSGGPDSTALLAALCDVGWARPVAVHVDHGIRPRDELEEEIALVKSNCAALGARLIVAHVRPLAVAERAGSSGQGIEAEARRYRYCAFRKALEKTGASTLLLAHTRGDQLETLLMRLFAGSGSGGLRGIPEAAGPFLRPFLGLEKAELLAYLEEKGLSYSTDSTNASTDYLRNRIRRELVPFLDSGFPGWRSGLDRASAKARRDDEALEEAALALNFDSNSSGGLCVSAADLFAAPEAVALRALVEAGGRLLVKDRFPSDVALEALRVLKRGDGSSYSGAGFVFNRREEKVELRYGLDFPRVRGYFILIDRPRSVRIGSIELRTEWCEASLGADCVPGIRADAFCFPLVVRSRRPGDSISFTGGTKRLDTLFSEWALPKEDRARVPVIEDCDGIVAVLGSSVGKKDRYRVGPSGHCGRRLSVIVKGA